jgi:hypothetical protein
LYLNFTFHDSLSTLSYAHCAPIFVHAFIRQLFSICRYILCKEFLSYCYDRIELKTWIKWTRLFLAASYSGLIKVHLECTAFIVLADRSTGNKLGYPAAVWQEGLPGRCDHLRYEGKKCQLFRQIFR